MAEPWRPLQQATEPVRESLPPVEELNSKARGLVLNARKELRPAAGVRERLEALLDEQIGSLPVEVWPELDHGLRSS